MRRIAGPLRTWAPAVALALGGTAWAGAAAAASSQGPGAAGGARAASQAPAPPRPAALGAANIGLVINSADAYSRRVGEHYASARGLRPQQVLRLALPQRGVLTRDEAAALAGTIAEHFGPEVQALALAWRTPYAVECQSITAVLALGFDPVLCAQSCGPPSRPSPYFASASRRPLADHGLRPAMLLAAADEDGAQALIARGVAADGSLSRRDRPPVRALLLSTPDSARRVRMALYPPAGTLPGTGVEIVHAPAEHLPGTGRVLLAITGSVRLQLDPPPLWVPGALADHLTSTGGALHEANPQSTVLEWIASGATASHGSVSEPCNHLQKFPHPGVLLDRYLRGDTAIEAYWKSVAWPQQSLFVGEPLAAPFARP